MHIYSYTYAIAASHSAQCSHALALVKLVKGRRAEGMGGEVFVFD